MPKLTADAPAKINLHLAVLDKRADGFHNLESVFLALDFGDTLHFEPAKGKKALDLTMEWSAAAPAESLSIEKNIVFKALSLFRDKTGFTQGLKIKVEKRIPLGGGLGGGSSDAASTLLALNKLAGFPLSRGELLQMAAALGSDVPFFICQTGAAWVTGRGEFIEPMEPPYWFFVLANPGFSSDTAAAFRLLDEYRDQNLPLAKEQRQGEPPPNILAPTSVPPLPKGKLCLREINFQNNLFNDFLPIFPEPQKSTYELIISQLSGLGAQYAGLSGAGSTCFGVFGDRAAAEEAAAALRDKWGFVAVTFNLR